MVGCEGIQARLDRCDHENSSYRLGFLYTQACMYKHIYMWLHLQKSTTVSINEVTYRHLRPASVNYTKLYLSLVMLAVSCLCKIAEESPLNSTLIVNILLCWYKWLLSYDRAKMKIWWFFYTQWLIFTGPVIYAMHTYMCVYMYINVKIHMYVCTYSLSHRWSLCMHPPPPLAFCVIVITIKGFI